MHEKIVTGRCIEGELRLLSLIHDNVLRSPVGLEEVAEGPGLPTAHRAHQQKSEAQRQCQGQR